jgi:hypothetical protein
MVTVAVRNIFARWNTGIVGSNLTQGMDVCMCVYSVFVLSCACSGLATGWSRSQGVLPTVYKIHIYRLILMGTGQRAWSFKADEDDHKLWSQYYIMVFCFSPLLMPQITKKLSHRCIGLDVIEHFCERLLFSLRNRMYLPGDTCLRKILI